MSVHSWACSKSGGGGSPGSKGAQGRWGQVAAACLSLSCTAMFMCSLQHKTCWGGEKHTAEQGHNGRKCLVPCSKIRHRTSHTGEGQSAPEENGWAHHGIFTPRPHKWPVSELYQRGQTSKAKTPQTLCSSQAHMGTEQGTHTS